LEHAYAAGLFDGEGFVRVAIWQKPNSPHVRYQVIAGIANTYRPVMEELQATFGGSLGDVRHDLRNPRNRVVFNWQIASRIAASFLRSIQPQLRIKKEQVELALQLQDHIDFYSLRGGNRKIIAERKHIYEERAALAAEIKRLKKVSYSPLVDSWPIESVNGR
jgi:hypothetical protein